MNSLRISPSLSKFVSAQNAQVERLEKRSALELLGLSREFQYKIISILEHLSKMGWKPVVYHGNRTKEEQAEKVRLGHSKTMLSMHVVGTQIHNTKNGFVFTKVGEAADIVDARFLWGGPCKALDAPFWRALGEAAKVQGLTWGGDWKKFPDVAHVELTKINITQDKRGVSV